MPIIIWNRAREAKTVPGTTIATRRKMYANNRVAWNLLRTHAGDHHAGARADRVAIHPPTQGLPLLVVLPLNLPQNSRNR